MLNQPRIALVIESSREYGRGLLAGIAAYGRNHGPWSIFFEPRASKDPIPSWLNDWNGDAIIARIESEAMGAQLLAMGVPTVDLRGFLLDIGIPLVETNDAMVPSLAMDHLSDCGFKRFAFAGFTGHHFSDVRCDHFEQLCRQKKCDCFVYEAPEHLRKVAMQEQVHHGLVSNEDLAAWLSELPKPIGLMACNDVLGQQVLNTCREADIPVPDDIGVIGVDNDPVLCELASPPLSSVVPDTFRIGYEAASIIDAMLKGDPGPDQPTYIDPIGIVERQSTDVLAIEDREIAAAIRFIREHACDPIDVNDVANAVAMSRSALERRFRSATNQTPNSHIIRVRINRIKQLLTETDLPIYRIAEFTGFEHTEYLNVFFKRETSLTPGKFRQTHDHA